MVENRLPQSLDLCEGDVIVTKENTGRITLSVASFTGVKGDSQKRVTAHSASARRLFTLSDEETTKLYHFLCGGLKAADETYDQVMDMLEREEYHRRAVVDTWKTLATYWKWRAEGGKAEEGADDGQG